MLGLEGRPRYTTNELQQDAGRLREYLKPPSTSQAQRLAAADADLRLVSLLSGRLDGDRLSALETAIQAENSDTISEIQRCEVQIRDSIADTLERHGIVLDNDDVGEALERLVAQVPQPVPKPPARSDPAPDTDSLADWRAARACTQLLADAEAAQADMDKAPNDPRTAMTALRRLACLVDEAPLRAPASGTMLARTVSCLTDMRDTLLEKLESQYKAQLRTVLHQHAWPPPECQNPDKANGGDSSDAYALLGRPDLERAWADLVEWQLTAASLGLRPLPTCIHTPPMVSGIDERKATPAAPGSDAYIPLLPVEVLMEPILLRFRYHFDGTRPTNRLDKPEWFLTHILALIRMNAYLFEPAPDAWTRGGDVAELTRRRRGATDDAPMQQRHMAVDAPSELLHTLLYPVRMKVLASMPRLLNERAFLAHMILQLITFDSELRDAYAPAVLAHGGMGACRLAEEVLGNDAWFQAWLDGERSFTESKFESVMEGPDAWSLVQADTMEGEEELVGDMATSDAATTTRCACTLMNVLAGVTERYQPLHLLEQKCAFVLQVQRPLLDQLRTRLTRHLDAFENMSTAFARTLPGEIASLSAGPGNDMVRGVNGVTRVAKALLSAEYVKQQLEEWSESSFFLHMAHELQQLDPHSPLYRLMSPKSTADKLDAESLTSLLHRGLQRGASAAASLRPLSSAAVSASTEAFSATETSADEFGVWDQYIDQFGQVSSRSARALEKLTVAEVLEAMRPYILRAWDRDPEVTDEESEATSSIPSPELVPALAKLTSLLRHIVQILSPSLLLPVYRHIAASLSKAVVDRIVMPHARITQRFTAAQAERFRQDVEQGWLHVVRELGDHPKIAARQRSGMPTGLGRNPEAAWRLLVEAIQQLS
ncbi:hypothetical protein MNAN1_001994 [Malassezia nana]|uniref:TIP-1 family-domain-containing protein n=1 Tax=Malassezia nana TaxID=180528 RepID=A0AAF0ERN6_9BASI|nr:hypothetical protein MNAN1_001994 [Malassezia nana]